MSRPFRFNVSKHIFCTIIHRCHKVMSEIRERIEFECIVSIIGDEESIKLALLILKSLIVDLS